jgi:SM-20-related protein
MTSDFSGPEKLTVSKNWGLNGEPLRLSGGTSPLELWLTDRTEPIRRDDTGHADLPAMGLRAKAVARASHSAQNSAGMGEASTDRTKGPLPPHARLTGFLPADEHGALLGWVLANERRFTPALVSSERSGRSSPGVDANQRIALSLRDLGPFEQSLSERLLAALPPLVAATGLRGAEPRSLELELTAYGDGAFYRAHIDIPTGPDRERVGARQGEDRVLSAVYYFYREPKAFSGGELRLYRFGADVEGSVAGVDFVDLRPSQNSLAAFPSWAGHEVRRVSCPSGQFADYRFALNCWYCRTLSR